MYIYLFTYLYRPLY